MLIAEAEVQTMLGRMSIGCLMVSLTGCVAVTEDAAGIKDEPAESRSASFYGYVFELGPGTAGPSVLLDDVEVCAHGGDSCTTTEHGSYWLEGIQPHSQSEVSFRKAGYVPAFVQAGVSDNYGNAEAALMSVAGARAFPEVIGASPLGETGGVVVRIMEPVCGLLGSLAGATFAVQEAHSAHSIYADDRGLADPELKSTSSAGWGVAFGIGPGMVTVEAVYEAGGRRCGSWSEQASELVNSAQVQVHAGALSVVTMVCISAGKAETPRASPTSGELSVAVEAS
jgi:hypothetical protein